MSDTTKKGLSLMKGKTGQGLRELEPFKDLKAYLTKEQGTDITMQFVFATLVLHTRILGACT